MMLQRLTDRINPGVILAFIVLLPLAMGVELLIGVAFQKSSDRSGDYSLDSYATYAVGDIIDATPSDLLSHPDEYARKLVQIDHVVARTMAIDRHAGGLQGSAQFAAYRADQPAAQVLLVDENSYVTPDCTSSTIGCPRFLGDRMRVQRIGDQVQYDKIQGRWLPINKYPIPRVERQPAYPYALWVAKPWSPGALGPR
jgi:hypothetical protein